MRNREPLNGRANLLRDLQRSLEWRVAEHHYEFLAAITRYEIARSAGHVAYGLGHGLEAGVAPQMTIGVVVCLEGIYVDHQDGQRMLLAQRRAPGSVQELGESAAVGDTGQRIAPAEAVQRRVRLFQLLRPALDLLLAAFDHVNEIAAQPLALVQRLA